MPEPTIRLLRYVASELDFFGHYIAPSKPLFLDLVAIETTLINFKHGKCLFFLVLGRGLTVIGAVMEGEYMEKADQAAECKEVLSRCIFFTITVLLEKMN